MKKDDRMHKWVFMCLTTALIAAVFGFGTVPKAVAIAGQVTCYLFLALAIIVFLANKLQSPGLPLRYRKNPMDDLNIGGNWNFKKGQLQQQFTVLTDDDLSYTEGQEDELIKRIQQRLGASKQEARNIIRNAT